MVSLELRKLSHMAWEDAVVSELVSVEKHAQSRHQDEMLCQSS